MFTNNPIILPFSIEVHLTEYWFLHFCIKSSNSVSKLAFDLFYVYTWPIDKNLNWCIVIILSVVLKKELQHFHICDFSFKPREKKQGAVAC